MSTEQILQFLFAGITIGSIYALIGIGFSIVFNSTAVVNLAHGEFVMLGGLFSVTTRVVLKLDLITSIVISCVLAMIAGVILERVVVRPLATAPHWSIVIALLGISIFLKNLAMLIWGKNGIPVPPFSSDTPIPVMGATIVPQTLWILGLTLLFVLAIRLFYQRTRAGRAMRACAVNPLAASLVGINVNRMVMLSYAISAALGTVAGIMIAPIAVAHYEGGLLLGIKGVSAAILGGLGNPMGAVVGGLVLGLVEAYGAGVISSAYKNVFALVVLLLLFYFRPRGLLGSGEGR